MPSVVVVVVVVVSGRAVSVVSTGFWRRSTPKAVWARYPRATALGPVERNPVPLFELGGVDYEVDDEYLAVISAADAEIAPGKRTDV